MEILYDVEFKGRRKVQYRNPNKLPVGPSDYVVVEAERGEHYGRVVRVIEIDEIAPETPCVLRFGTKEDQDRVIKNQFREKEAFVFCKEQIAQQDLPMKLVDVEYQMDGARVTFFFTADQRIDFCELVKTLAAVYRTRIEMRQIGARDEAKRSCSIGSCGRPLCCGAFLDTFRTVTTDMIEHQHLSLSPSKLLGACGRLKCCLLYEEGYYEEAGKRFPKLGAHIVTETGPCEVVKIDVIGDAILVKYETGVMERIPRSRLGSRGCDRGACHDHEEEHHHGTHTIDAVFVDG